MPLVPEKLNSRQEVRNAISSQFWDQPVHSVRSVDGTARTLPCEPPPIGQTAASGLLRSQELLATQAAGLPVMPGFSSLDGGLVLDRVLARTGGRNWWTTVSGRARAQQMWSAYKAGMRVGETLKDLENYSLSSRSRLALGRNASLNYVLEAPNARDLRSDIKRRSRKAMRKQSTEQSKSAYKSQAWLKYHLPGHDVVGTAAWNQDQVDSAASYCTVPTTVSCDLASKDRPDGIQYRVGLHQVSAPEVEGSSTSLHSLPGSSRASARTRSSLHVQGAVAVEGEAHIWRPGRKGSSSAPDAEGSDAVAPAEKDSFAAANGVLEPASEVAKAVEHEIAAQKDIAAQGHDGAVSQSMEAEQSGAALQVQPSSPPPSSAAEDPRTAVDLAHQSQSVEAVQRQPTVATATTKHRSQKQQQHEQATQTASRTHQPSEATASRPQAANGLRDKKAASSRPRRPWSTTRKGTPGRTGNVLADQYSSIISDSEDSDAEEAQPVSLLRNVDAGSIQSSIKEAHANIDKLRQVLSVVTAGVEEGKSQLEQQHQVAIARRHKRKPYSPWLSQPFLKVNAAVGCLARMPLPHSAFKPLESRFNESQTQAALDRPTSRFSPDLWQPYLRDTALRIFGSVGLTGQLGRFTRPVLDFTAGSVRLDFGLTSPHRPSLAPVSSYGNLSVFNPRQDHLDSADLDGERASPSRPLGTRFKNRAFALEGRGIWHALSASVTQQLIGPIRLRGDLRCALDLPSSVQPNAHGKRTLKKFREAAQKTRPTLLETTIGLDVVIPGSSGIARAAVWYSPKRREGMAEIKLF